MANIFISYGDNRFKESLNRIARQAQKVGVFDKVIKYTPKDLPSFITSSPLFAFSRGGGYMCWKPYIIYHTLKNCREGDVVYYADAGCTLVKDSPEWALFRKQIEEYSSIFFQYRKDYYYKGWDKYCNHIDDNCVAAKHWMKPSLTNFFLQFISSEVLDFSELWSGFIIVRKNKSIPFLIKQWLNITLFHPELIADPYGAEIEALPESYCAHRHDQSVVTALVFHYQKEENVLVLPETAESRIGNPAVLATRWRQEKLPFSQHLKYRLWCLLHGE